MDCRRLNHNSQTQLLLERIKSEMNLNMWFRGRLLKFYLVQSTSCLPGQVGKDTKSFRERAAFSDLEILHKQYQATIQPLLRKAYSLFTVETPWARDALTPSSLHILCRTTLAQGIHQKSPSSWSLNSHLQDSLLEINFLKSISQTLIGSLFKKQPLKLLKYISCISIESFI